MALPRLVRCFLTSLLVVATGAGAVHAQSEQPIVVFVAKKIYTMDPGWPTATAVAVRDGKILSVGSMEDLQPWLKGREYKVIDSFKNKILFPGFIESHGHPFLGGTLMRLPLLTHYDTPNPYGSPFKGLKSREAALAKLKEYEHALADPNELLVAWGFDSVVYGGHLTRHDLDKISSTRPIIVWDASEHFAYLNSAVIKQRGYTSELAKKINGVQLGSDGELNGQFLGTTAATFALGDFLKSRSEPAQAKKSLDFMIDLSVQGGITTQSELVLGLIDPEGEAKMYSEYFNDPKTPMRLVAVSDIEGLNAAKKEKAVSYMLDLQQQSTDKIIFRGVKSFSDDSFLGFGMMVGNPGYISGRE